MKADPTLISRNRLFLYFCLCTALFCASGRGQDASPLPPSSVLTGSWQMRDAPQVPETGAQLSRPGFVAPNWYKATVPGTVLTTLVDNGVYPEPLYGENNRPNIIPDSLCRKDWWYRTDLTVPTAYAGKKIWLTFEGINYAAEVWVNGTQVGTIKGAFTRGIFEISALVTPGQPAAVAVRISPQPHPGIPSEHTIANGLSHVNGGLTAIDGPTFLCSIGWDWLPAIRDRDSGIWQKVTLSASGPAVMEDPAVTSDLSLPSLASAEVAIKTNIRNLSNQPQNGMLKGSFGGVSFAQPVQLPPSGSTLVALDSKTLPQLRLTDPKLWWPNGYGPQNLYHLHLSLEIGGVVSDTHDISFGIRKITYGSPTDNLTISVNGVPIFIKGGDWGMDEGMKRIPRERLEAQIRMHQIAHYNMIRNWVGQSTGEDLYELCDQYGIMVWDEFFQPNPGDGPNLTDVETYLANCREKLVRFRNHPCIALWCGRNEGHPPKEIDDALIKLTAELDPTRLYQSSSGGGRGVSSGGPYRWRTPREYYEFPDKEAFKTEIGSVSVPTWESIQGMMPEKDWTQINDDWAEHDLGNGAQGGNTYPGVMASRYGPIANAADFARKGQLMNYEAFRAMYEGREAKMFHFATAVITWMSNPAQPSFVWQIYAHDLEPNSALFAVRKACEPVHIQLNEELGSLQVINSTASSLEGAQARVAIYNLDGSLANRHEYPVNAPASAATDLGHVDLSGALAPVHFVKLELHAADGQLLSDNFYWQADAANPDDLTALDKLPIVPLQAKIVRRDADGKIYLDVTLRNPGPAIALAAHLQLHRSGSGERVLPVYYTDNYVSLVPDEQKTITIEAAAVDLKGQDPLVLVDGWNIGVQPVTTPGARLALNENAQVSHWPANGLPIVSGPHVPTPTDFHINCGGPSTGSFQADDGFVGGEPYTSNSPVDIGTLAVPAALFQTGRAGNVQYLFQHRPQRVPVWYDVRLYFAESTFQEAGKRRFDVEINGKKVLNDFDIFQEAGGANKAVMKEFPLVLANRDGTMEIRLESGSAAQPEICGFEIIKTNHSGPQPDPSATPDKATPSPHP